MPRRVSSAQASSAESCWLHDVRTLATRDLSNETSRERFTCVVAYSFVWRDLRTSVAHPLARRPLATSLREATCGRVIASGHLRRGSLRKAFTFLRCISAQPAFLSACRFLCRADSFHSASSAEFCSAYPTLLLMESLILELKFHGVNTASGLNLWNGTIITFPSSNDISSSSANVTIHPVFRLNAFIAARTPLISHSSDSSFNVTVACTGAPARFL